MSNELRPVWEQVERLLNEGVNLIPVRDRDEQVGAKLFEKKTPYSEWKKYIHSFIDRQTLFNEMEARDTAAVAMVCGAISGNLEVIDVDVKYLPGIDVRLFADLKELYPDILEKLRIHKSPSGGCHIVYRIEAGHAVPGSTALAQRAATDEEILEAPKRSKKRCFIETRGEGGLCTAPPSMGYIVRKDCPIPVLTWVERCTLIELCRSYNTYIKVDAPYKPNRVEANYYDENPFEHYNRTCDPVEVLAQCGWVYVSKRGNFMWFTRPGGRKGEVHGSVDMDRRVFHVFGMNTDLEGDRAYNFSTILAFYFFNNDKQKTYQWLVAQGYGRIKPEVETRIVKTKALTGDPLPENISPQGRELHQQAVAQLNAAHAHGIFWAPDEKGNIQISRLRFEQVAHDLGFRLHNTALVQVDGIYVYRRDDRFFYDTMKAYINEDDGDLYEDIFNAFHGFYQKNGKFCIECLDQLQAEKILYDTRTTCYKFYLNGYVEINAQGFDLYAYDAIVDNLIWHEKVQPRDFILNTGAGLYTDFLDKAVDLPTNRAHIMKTLGFLAHEYMDETTAYFVVLSETCPDPLQGGGSGKNLFCNLLKLTTTYTSKPGAQTKSDEKFLQTWRGEKIFAISDAPKDFDFSFLKEPTGGNAVVKRLFKDEITVDVKDMCKFIIQTNYSSDIQDGGVKRRIIQIEFGDFFTRAKGVDVHYEKHFPNDWQPQDYGNYDTFICQSVHMWISGGLKLQNITLSGTGWEKQFIYTFGQVTYDFIVDNWETNWRGNFVSNEAFNKQLADFLRENNIGDRFKPSSMKINNALKEWCAKHGYGLSKNEVKRTSPFSTERGREFLEEPPF